MQVRVDLYFCLVSYMFYIQALFYGNIYIY
jgi:hypothetical protein